MPRVDNCERDLSIIRHIFGYCSDIATTHAEFGRSKEKFLMSRTYQNAVSMCILQIGELIKHLSPEFTQTHPAIDWRSAARARDIYAHHYGHLDFEIAWESATAVIDELTEFCRGCLN